LDVVSDAIFEEELDVNTTHVVVNEIEEKTPRTMKVLAGIAGGLWVLNKSWIDDSIKKGKWLNEEDYEIKFPGATLSRKNKEATKPLLFDGLKFFINQPQIATTEDLEGLISNGGGDITKKFKEADICISGKPLLKSPEEKIVIVTEEWIYDSLQYFKKQDYSKYAIKNEETEELSFPEKKKKEI